MNLSEGLEGIQNEGVSGSFSGSEERLSQPTYARENLVLGGKMSWQVGIVVRLPVVSRFPCGVEVGFLQIFS